MKQISFIIICESVNEHGKNWRHRITLASFNVDVSRPPCHHFHRLPVRNSYRRTLFITYSSTCVSTTITKILAKVWRGHKWSHAIIINQWCYHSYHLLIVLLALKGHYKTDFVYENIVLFTLFWLVLMILGDFDNNGVLL